MVAVGDMHALPAPLGPLVAVVKNFEPVKVVQIPLQAHVLAVDFQGVERLVPPGVTSAFKKPE